MDLALELKDAICGAHRTRTHGPALRRLHYGITLPGCVFGSPGASRSESRPARKFILPRIILPRSTFCFLRRNGGMGALNLQNQRTPLGDLNRQEYNQEHYEVVKTKDFFKQGVERLKTAYNNDVNVAIMCSESNPCECHRSKLIGRVLNFENIILQHIDENEKLKDQITVINELNKGLAEIDLFGNPINITSRKAYL